MEYSLDKDLLYAQEILQLSDQDFCDLLKISRTTLFRYKQQLSMPSVSQLEHIYSTIYKMNVDLNRIKEELFLSQSNSNTKILFHGSKSGIIGNPSIEYSGDNKDFGKGFYLGESIKQAISFVSTFTNSSLYIFRLNNFNKIKKIEYDVSIEWMILIACFRGKIN